MSEDSRRLAEARSLELHRAIARRMNEDPEILARARARVEAWVREMAVPARYAREWQRLLRLPPEELEQRMTERTEVAHDLRQVSPFAGALDARTRWRIYKATGERLRHETRGFLPELRRLGGSEQFPNSP